MLPLKYLFSRKYFLDNQIPICFTRDQFSTERNTNREATEQRLPSLAAYTEPNAVHFQPNTVQKGPDMRVRLMLMSIAFLGSMYMIPSLSAQTPITPPNTVSHVRSEPRPNDICGDSCGGDCDDYECCDPETGYDCPIPPEVPPTLVCVVWLQAREVFISDLLPTGAVHTFWSWKDGPTTGVLDAGPTGTSLTALGFLNSWWRIGPQGHLAGDNMGTAAVLGSTEGDYACTQAGNLDAFQLQWPNNYIFYQVTGPNSNSFTSRGGIAADVTLEPPFYVVAPGWGK